MKTPEIIKLVALVVIGVLVGFSLLECHLACCVIHLKHPYIYTTLLAISYVSLILLKVYMFRRKEAGFYLWLVRGLIIGLLLLPHLLHIGHLPSSEVIKATIVDSETVVSFAILATIESLLDVWIWFGGGRKPKK